MRRIFNRAAILLLSITITLTPIFICNAYSYQNEEQQIEQINFLRSLKVKVLPGQTKTLGARINNVRLELLIHSIGYEAEEGFQYQIYQEMFPDDAKLTMHGRRFQALCWLLLNANTNESAVYDEFGTLYNEWSAANTFSKPQIQSPSTPYISAPAISSSIIESRIDGDFEGWDGDTIFKLTNGQIWQQESFAYTYHYAFMPEVIIYQSGSGYKMKVDGVNGEIYVKRLK